MNSASHQLLLRETSWCQNFSCMHNRCVTCQHSVLKWKKLFSFHCQEIWKLILIVNSKDNVSISGFWGVSKMKKIDQRLPWTQNTRSHNKAGFLGCHLTTIKSKWPGRSWGGQKLNDAGDEATSVSVLLTWLWCQVFKWSFFFLIWRERKLHLAV